MTMASTATTSSGYYGSRRGSTFSDKNLTTLESLLLECQLEDAKQYQQMQSSRHSAVSKSTISSLGTTGTSNTNCTATDVFAACEMSAQDYQALSRLPGNDACADCGERGDTEWASVSFGILLCAECSGVHRAMGTHISRVKSIKMDNWPPEHLELMRKGGNQACQTYLERRGVLVHHLGDEYDEDDIDALIQDRYSSEAAQTYKQLLKDRATNASAARTTRAGRTSSSSASSSPQQAKSLVSLDETESCSTTESSGESSMRDLHLVTKVSSDNSQSVLEDESAKSFMGDDDDSDDEIIEEHMEEEEEGMEKGMDVKKKEKDGDDKQKVQKGAALALDSWFAKKNKAAAVSEPSVCSRRSRRIVQRSKSSTAAPTITYMGRSFSAGGSDDTKLFDKNEDRVRRQADVQLLADMADQQEKIARENATVTPWRQAIPPSHFTANRKIEPFTSADGYGSRRRSIPDKRRRHHESLRQKLAYTDADVLHITQNADEFARLKAGLKSKGAVTNEVLKQKLYAFVANSKLRKEMPTPTRVQRGVQATKSEDLSSMRSRSIHTSTALCM